MTPRHPSEPEPTNILETYLGTTCRTTPQLIYSAQPGSQLKGGSHNGFTGVYMQNHHDRSRSPAIWNMVR